LWLTIPEDLEDEKEDRARGIFYGEHDEKRVDEIRGEAFMKMR
jgi:hypothetical protein